MKNLTMTVPFKIATSLRTKVLLLLTSMFIFFAGMATINAILNFEATKKAKQVEFQWAAKWLEGEQHRHIAQAGQVAFVVMNHIRKGLTEQTCRHGVTSEPGLDPEFGHFAIADPDGKISCNSIPWLTADSFANQENFKQAIKNADLSFIDEADNHNPSQYTAVLARAMRDNEHVQKVILVSMDFSWVNEEIDMIHLPESGHLLVVDAKGTVIAGSRNVAKWVDKSIADTSFYRHIISAKPAFFNGLGFTGTNSFIVTNQFKTGSGDMRVIIDIPREVLLQPAYRNLTITLVSSAAVFALIMLLVYYWSNKQLLRKILAIERTAEMLSSGDLTNRVGAIGKDELGDLAQSLDTMADSLQSQEIQLKSANDELYRVNRSLRVLSAGNRSLLFAESEQELLDRICRAIVEEGGYLAAWIGFTGPGRDVYLRTGASYFKSENASSEIDWNMAENGLEPIITAIREDCVLTINDTNHDTVHKQLNEHAAKFGYRSLIILPLHLEGKPFGALILCAYRENEFGNLQIEYLKETASDISVGIEMLRTKGERNRLAFLEEHNELVLRDSLEDTLRAISLTIEMRDPYTAGHQRRVADLAKALARNLGLSDDEAHGIYLAAIVHDIGKINIPAEILVKPTELNKLEYALIKNHAVSGYEILKDIKFPWPIAELVHQHHERLDGSGYPLGISDGGILFGARILAVADVVEAMSSHRPYRPGRGIDAALEEIEKGKSTVYDATVVDACVKIFRENGFKFA